MDILIREIADQDYPEAAVLLVHDLWNDTISGSYIVPFFDKIRSEENYQTFVAILDGQVVGLASTVTMLWASSNSANLFLQAIVVKNDCQRQGVGTKLLCHIEDYARAHGIAGIGLQSGVQRTGAHAFYERLGYTKSHYFYKNF